MEMKILEKDKNMMKIEVSGSDEATLYLLTQQLLSDENVKVATYSMPHPQLDKPVLYLETNSGWPKTALKNAVLVLEGHFESGLKVLEKDSGVSASKTKKSPASKGKAKVKAPAKKAAPKKPASKQSGVKAAAKPKKKAASKSKKASKK